MHIPIEHEHAPGPELRDGQSGRDRDVVEQAESHRPVRFGVVARRAYRAEAHRSLAGHQRARHRARRAGRMPCGLKRALPDEGVGIECATARRTELLDQAHVARGVDQPQLLVARGGRLATLPFGPRPRREGLLDRPQPPRRVGVAGRVRLRVVGQARGVAEVEPRGRAASVVHLL